MAEQVMAQKLESLRRCLGRIRQHLPERPEGLLHDPDRQDIIALNLTRAIQIAADMASHHIAGRSDIPAPQSMGQSFQLLADCGVIDAELAVGLRKAVGFRNILVRSYETINWEIVFALCTERLADFERFAQSMAKQ